MGKGLRLVLPLLAALLALVLSSAALSVGTTDQLIVPPTNGTGCSGFPHETIDGTVTGCTPNSAGFPFGFFSVAAEGSIAFMTDAFSGVGSIWLAKPDGSSVQLADNAFDQDSPSISYDGSTVVFDRFNPATGSSDIYSVKSDGSDLQLIVSGHGKQRLRVPAISPDGSTVLYWCAPADQDDDTSRGCGPLTDGSYRNSGLMRIDIDGSNPRMIVIGPGVNDEPDGPSSFSWSPDSRWLATDGSITVGLGNDVFADQDELFEYRTDGSDLFNNEDPARQITHFKYVESARFDRSPDSPRFSPDGSQLLYMDFVDGNGNEGNFSYLVGIDGSDPHRVFLNDGGYEYGEFIPTAAPGSPPPLVDMTHIRVPSVKTLHIRAAAGRLKAHHLNVGTVNYEYSAAVAKNRIATQFPVAGAVAHRTTKRGPRVAIAVSLGAAPRGVQLCVVPRAEGKTLNAARRAITARNCTVGEIHWAFSRRVEKGRVLSESPGPGAKLRQSATVALVVSRGRRH